MTTEALPMPVRFRLLALLEEAGLTQRELSIRSGLSPTIINRMAKNHATQVSLNTLYVLSRTLSEAAGRYVEPGELFELTDPPTGRKRGTKP